jgi:phage terminase large subunit-like protein
MYTVEELKTRYPNSFLLEYIKKCRSGEIIVGRELLQEFDILISNFSNPDIIYDTADAEKRIRFIETKTKLYEAPFSGKPFILLLYQKAFVIAFYSFKIYDDELKRYRRLFNEFLLLCAKKNGKSPFFAALCLAEYFCGFMGCKILCTSNSYEEAAAMFDGIEAMRVESKSLEHVTRSNVHGIFFGNPNNKKGGKFSRHNKGNIRKMSAKTGAQDSRNIMVGAVDEVWELKDNSTPSFVKKALSSQDEPIYGEISTQGTVNDGYLDDRLAEALRVLDPDDDFERPYWMVWLYLQDNESEIWTDEQSWYKSNPSLGQIKKWRYLRDRIEEAKTSKKERVLTLCKDFNIKTGTSSAWLTPQEYENPVTFADIAKEKGVSDIMEYLRGCYMIGGVDLAETTDLACAKALIMHKGDTHKYILRKYMIPESKLDNCPDDLDYKELARQGKIIICPGNENDFTLFTQWYIELFKKWGIKPYKLCYDNAMAKFWVKEMEETFGDEIMERVPQTHVALSSPMLLLEQDLKSKFIIYDCDPIDNFCLKNTAMDINKYGQIKPMKDQSRPTNRIDGTAALLDCYFGYQAFKPDYMKYVG